MSDAPWCNCQAIPGTQNYPGPWHPKGDEPWYPCSNVHHSHLHWGFRNDSGDVVEIKGARA